MSIICPSSMFDTSNLCANDSQPMIMNRRFFQGNSVNHGILLFILWNTINQTTSYEFPLFSEIPMINKVKCPQALN